MSGQRAVEVRSSEDGVTFSVAGDSTDLAFMRWSEVESVLAYKRDVWAFDLICLRFSTAKSEFEANEEMAGWSDLVEVLPQFLPGLPSFADWWGRVAQPPFAPCVTTLYKRG